MTLTHPIEKPPSETADTAGAGTTPAETVEKSPTLTQADIDRIVTERLERQKKQLLKQAEELKADEEAKRLEATAEWQELAKKRETQLSERDQRISELERQAALAEKYEGALQQYVEKLSDGLPPAIVSLLEPMDSAARLEWLTANREQFVAPSPEATPEPPAAETAVKRPIPPTPPPQGSSGLPIEERRKRAARTF